MRTDRVAEPFMSGKNTFTHGITFGGHPVSAAIALANLDIFEREDLCGHVREKEGEFRGMLDKLRDDLPIVGDVRGAGYFQALELVKDKETKETFSDEESEELLRGFMSGELFTVVMPSWRVTSGNRGSACATRFCTSCCALSGSVPSRNVTLNVIKPSAVAWLLI